MMKPWSQQDLAVLLHLNLWLFGFVNYPPLTRQQGSDWCHHLRVVISCILTSITRLAYRTASKTMSTSHDDVLVRHCDQNGEHIGFEGVRPVVRFKAIFEGNRTTR